MANCKASRNVANSRAPSQSVPVLVLLRSVAQYCSRVGASRLVGFSMSEPASGSACPANASTAGAIPPEQKNRSLELVRGSFRLTPDLGHDGTSHLAEAAAIQDRLVDGAPTKR